MTRPGPESEPAAAQQKAPILSGLYVSATGSKTGAFATVHARRCGARWVAELSSRAIRALDRVRLRTWQAQGESHFGVLLVTEKARTEQHLRKRSERGAAGE